MPRATSRPPAVQKKNTVVVQQQPPKFGDMMKQGFALGAGQAVAHQVIGSVFRTFSSSTAVDCTAYQTCLTKVDKASCDTLYEQCSKP